KPDANLLQQEYVAPQSDLEQQIAAIWQDVLKLERVGLTDNFFELGGDSIISIQVVSRARQAGIRFTPKELFQHQTVQGLASVARQGEEGSLQIDQRPVTGEALLLPIHQYFFEEAIEQRHHWNQSLLLKPGQPLDGTQLEQALHALIVHHDALRLGFTEQADGQWKAQYRSVDDQQKSVLWQKSLQSADALEQLCNEAQRSLNLQDGPLIRAVLASLPDGSQRLLLAIHHLAVDGVSWRILLEDLQSAYTQVKNNQPVRLSAKTSSTQAWAEQLQAYASSEVLQQEQAYWTSQLQGVSAELPCDYPGGSLQGTAGTHATTRLDQDYTRKLLQDAPVAYRTQINDLLLTALARVIARWTERVDVLIQLEGHGREDLFETIDLTRTVGWFTSMFPVKLTPQAALVDSIKQIKEQLRAIPEKGIGFGALRYLGSEASRRALAELPQPRITFNYLGQFDGSFNDENIEQDSAFLTPAGEASGDPQSLEAPLGNWLSINGHVYGGELNLNWSFSRDMFAHATIQRLADEYAMELKQLIEHCSAETTAGVTPSDFPLVQLSQVQLDALPISARDIEDIYPLSPMQQGMLFHTLYQQEAGDYINQMRVDVRGLEVQRFRQAWQAALETHDILRTRFIWEGLEQPVQVVCKPMELPFAEYDWRAQVERSAALDTLAEAELKQGFELGHAPLLRLVLVRTAEDAYHLIYTSHHILMDGWSNSQLLGEVLQRYAGQVRGQTPGKYRDYIAWLQRQDKAVSEAFWSGQLKRLDEPTRLAQAVKASTPNLPVDEKHGSHGDLFHVLDKEKTRRLGEFARQQKVTINTVVQAAWLLLLQRYTGQDTVAFGATVSGRPAELKGVEQQVGLFINTLPVIAAPRPEQPLGEWLQQVQAQNLALREQEHTPLFEIQRWAGLGGEALFDTLLVFENYPISEALEQGAPPSLVFSEVETHEQTNYPLTLAMGLGEELSFHYSYAHDYFGKASIARIAEQLVHLLIDGLGHAERAVGDLALLDEAQQQQVVQDWNPAPVHYASERCIHQVIEDQVARTPNAVALAFGDQSLSYVELNRRANRLAHKLRELGVGPDVLVGLSVERSLEMVVGLLAILKAGGAYVPLDPEYPEDRLKYMMDDSGVRLLLTQSYLQKQLPVLQHIEVLNLDEIAAGLEVYSEANLINITRPANLAYVIYTSGSTGKPKGTLLPHHNVMRLFQATNDWFHFDDQDVWTVFHSYAFDFSVWELYGALLYGGKAVVVPKDVMRSPESFHALLCREQVTVLSQTPSAFKQLIPVACVSEKSLALRYVVFGGEALDVGSLASWFDRFGDHAPQLINMYGITETTVHVTYRPLSRSDVQQALISPIGEAIPDLSWYLLDGQLNPAVPGVQGELHVGRAGLARGYHNRPALTAERFIPDPFDTSELGGSRLYRSGDLARAQVGGVVEYAGRIDHQVKIRGFRIELGEIEIRLKEHAWIQEAVVLNVDGQVGPQLVAYLVPVVDQQGDEKQSALREHLRRELKAVMPDYMVPAHFVFLEHLPLTANGKLDRKVLPKPDASQQQQIYVQPQSELEQEIAAIWAHVLQVERVGLNDNFFELGGHSLLATQMISRLPGHLGREGALRHLFEYQCLGEFVSNLVEKSNTNDPLQSELAKSLEALKRLNTEEIDELIS
ncbi:amino acid adenylation domain-containing protein, partial [Pseudomonas sp. 21LCFQ010]|uniref:non-ribosomal peptide synthetase n=1 Tax=Pseudomonas sp. 21LCFQ010 TaxID=2957506 RepID=UPI0020973A7F